MPQSLDNTFSNGALLPGNNRTPHYITPLINPNGSCLFAVGSLTDTGGSQNFKTFSTRQIAFWWQSGRCRQCCIDFLHQCASDIEADLTGSGIAMDSVDRNREAPHLGDWWGELTTTPLIFQRWRRITSMQPAAGFETFLIACHQIRLTAVFSVDRLAHHPNGDRFNPWTTPHPSPLKHLICPSTKGQGRNQITNRSLLTWQTAGANHRSAQHQVNRPNSSKRVFYRLISNNHSLLLITKSEE